MKPRPHKMIRPPRHWPSYAVALSGISLTLFIWYALGCHFSLSLENYFTQFAPAIVLVLGVLLSILLAIIVRLIYVGRKLDKLLKHSNRNYKEETLKHQYAEESKARLEKALLQGQKLQAIGTLASGIAHDFNNILYAITGYTEMSRDDVQKESIVYQNLGKVLEASHRGQELIARILTFSRRQQHHEYKPLDIEHTFESVLALLRPTVPATVALELSTTHHHMQVLGDQTQLHQIIVNIVNNAVDAMDGEGKIHIVLSRIEANHTILNALPDSQNKSYCRIDITDTGHGMDLTTVERIFEPFFTTKEVGKGTGLGLSTVHSLIKEHQGEIWVDSQLGRGTTFTLLLPEYVKETGHGQNITR